MPGANVATGTVRYMLEMSLVRGTVLVIAVTGSAEYTRRWTKAAGQSHQMASCPRSRLAEMMGGNYACLNCPKLATTGGNVHLTPLRIRRSLAIGAVAAVAAMCCTGGAMAAGT